MLEPHSPEIRAQLAADRVAGLRHSARPVPPGLLRRSLGNAFVRLGLRLGSDGSVRVPSARWDSALAESHRGDPRLRRGTSLKAAASRQAVAAATPSPPFTWDDFERELARELAAPYGVRVSRR